MILRDGLDALLHLELHLTPLHCAARYCTVSEMAARVIEYLLGNGANDVADVRGYR